jgi:hypothetical protein
MMYVALVLIFYSFCLQERQGYDLIVPAEKRASAFRQALFSKTREPVYARRASRFYIGKPEICAAKAECFVARAVYRIYKRQGVSISTSHMYSGILSLLIN